jgi:hypothetical protein
MLYANFSSSTPIIELTTHLTSDTITLRHATLDDVSLPEHVHNANLVPRIIFLMPVFHISFIIIVAVVVVLAAFPLLLP